VAENDPAFDASLPMAHHLANYRFDLVISRHILSLLQEEQSISIAAICERVVSEVEGATQQRIRRTINDMIDDETLSRNPLDPQLLEYPR
jgi:hypothetical protein